MDGEKKKLGVEEIALANHKALFERRGVEWPGTFGILPVVRGRNNCHRFNCKCDLDPAVLPICIRCEWLICTCGECGCGCDLSKFYLPFKK